MNYLNHVDPRLRRGLEEEAERLARRPAEPLPRGATVVLAGHRGAGKTSVLPLVAQALGRPAVDLDEVVAREVGGRAAMNQLVERAQGEFRRLERTCFEALPRGAVVAVGGGFLLHHAARLSGCVTAMVPLTEETFRERLRADTTRPRLHPELSLEEELTRVWLERELAHTFFRGALGLPELLHRGAAGLRPRRVVTLPKGADGVAFARRARAAGAELLEVRTDLFDGEVEPLARELPLLVAERGRPAPKAWRAQAHLLDLEDGAPLEARPEGSWLRSFHAPGPLAVGDALARWADVPREVAVKHVEPLGAPAEAARLFELQRRLVELRGGGVTVLGTGELALPARARLAVGNSLEYCALDAATASAPGQRLLEDVVREHRAGPPRAEGRLGIVGSRIAGSRSPRIHRQPFDRIELPEGADAAALVASLGWYRGLAVTSPFKRRVLPGQTVNTLARRGGGWQGANTDVQGARAALEKLGASKVQVLGEGGVAPALRAAAASLGVELAFVRQREKPSPHGGGCPEGAGEGRDQLFPPPLREDCLWTWPPHVAPPAGLRLDGQRVGVIAYGHAAHQVAARIRALGGAPIFLGSRWFIAQARAQRALWQEAP